MTKTHVLNARTEIPRHLADRGIRLTGGRRAVIDTLSAEKAPLSVADIQARLTKRRVNLATIYRTVGLLQRLGLLSAVDAAQGSQRYELSERFTGHHHHVVCEACGAVQDLTGCVLPPRVLDGLRRKLERSFGFTLSHHDLKLVGRCEGCTPRRAASKRNGAKAATA